MELVIVRHGETEWTMTGQFTGSTEQQLTPNGRREASLLRGMLGGVLRGRAPVVYSSPRRRALDTARLVLPDEEIIVDPLLAELDYGIYEGLTPEQVRDMRPGWDIWVDGCPGGESVADAGSRAERFLVARASRSDQGPVVVISHGHFSRILAARALGLSADEGRLFASATASVSVVGDDHGERCIGLWNASPILMHGSADDIAPTTGQGAP
jgi:probable phosphoglycerate mutase